jgi:hypothetical protein
MNPEEFIGNPIPAEIIMLGNLSFNFYEITKASAAFPAPVAFKLYHAKITIARFIL